MRKVILINDQGGKVTALIDQSRRMIATGAWRLFDDHTEKSAAEPAPANEKPATADNDTSEV